ncbi:hypothetical protein ACSSV1_001211 [Labrenzia sp. MBR-25]
MKSAEEKKVHQFPEVPQASENVLLGLAIAAAVLTSIGAFVAWVYVFWAPNWFIATIPSGQTAADRAGAITPFLAVGAAVVTFFSVLWRGAINSRQAFEQKRQNDSKDEVELGLLLEKAAIRLREKESADQILAIVMIETIVLAENDKYAIPALELLRDQWRNWHTIDGFEVRRSIERAELLFTMAKQKGRVCPPMDIEFDWSPERSESLFDRDEGPYRFFWDPAASPQKQFLKLTQSLPVRNLTRVKVDVTEETVIALNEFAGRFDSCWFQASPRHQTDAMREKVVVNSNSSGSTYVNLSIKRVGNPGYCTSFIRCDFSDAFLENPFVYSIECTYENCRYYHKTPPILYGLGYSMQPDFLKKFETYLSVDDMFGAIEPTTTV